MEDDEWEIEKSHDTMMELERMKRIQDEIRRK